MTTTEQALVRLNNGVQIPALGFGVFQTAPEDTIAAVTTALDDGYRLIDTAAADKTFGILTQAWSPIGGIHRYRPAGTGDSDVLKNPVITDLAAKYGKTPAQVVLRWHLDEGRSALPKSVTPSRIAQNIDVFDFTLEPGELAAIDALDTGLRGGPDPELLNTRTFPKTVDNS